MDLTDADGHAITARILGGGAGVLGMLLIAAGALLATDQNIPVIGILIAGAGTMFVLMAGVALVVTGD